MIVGTKPPKAARFWTALTALFPLHALLSIQKESLSLRPIAAKGAIAHASLD